MRLVDQWGQIRSELPESWESIRLTLQPESPGDLPRAAAVLGPMNAGRLGSSLVFDVRRAGGSNGPAAAETLFGRLDADRVWCTLEAGDTALPAPPPTSPSRHTVTMTWEAALAPLPDDWSDLLCELELDSSDHLPRAALLCAPVNPTRDPERMAFVFRCARRAGYGVSPQMARRCFQRLDAEGITGRVRVLRALSETDPVGTQGPTWIVGGRVL